MHAAAQALIVKSFPCEGPSTVLKYFPGSFRLLANGRRRLPEQQE